MSELAQAIEEMRNMRESYDQLAGAAEAYNEGKPALAEAITAKGVEAAATDSLATMAEKVMTISQDTYEIDGGEMYAKQLFGVANNDIVPGYWNLYDILAQLLSDGRLMNYGGILLAEYYKGYDSLALAGAGAGGAYVVSDKDENGQFKMYTDDTTHVWATEDDGKGNRWVAYCFADEYHDFQITNTNTSPRSIFIGRKVGEIKNLTASRTSQIVIPDGNELGGFVSNNFSNPWDRIVVLKNIKITNGTVLNLGSHDHAKCNTELVYIQTPSMTGGNITTVSTRLTAIIVEGRLSGGTIIYAPNNGTALPLTSIYLRGEYIHTSLWTTGQNIGLQNMRVLGIYDVEDASIEATRYLVSISSSCKVFLSYKNNDKTKSVVLNGIGFDAIQDLSLLHGWCKPITISSFVSLTEANMYSHILQRLKQDEADCGDGVTITLGSTNLAKLTSAESVALLQSLRSTYGYTIQ